MQPALHGWAGGRSASFPLGAPALTQATSVSMSCWLSRGSLRNFKLPFGSAGHGGISRLRTCSLIDSAQGFVVSYDKNDSAEAISPGR